MRVFFDYQAFSRQHYGGVSRYFVELARILPTYPDLSLRVGAPLYINRYLGELPAATVSGHYLPRSPKSAGRLFNVYNRRRTSAQVREFRPDIYHATYFNKTEGLATSARQVLTVYDMIHERFPQYFAAWDRTARNKKLAVARADHIICISETTRRDLIEILGTPAEKVSVTLLGFAAPQPAAAPADSATSKNYLLYVGVRSGYKNFDTLLNAFAANTALRDNFRLVCFGGGPFNRSELVNHQRLGLSSKIEWLGGSDQVLSALYLGAAAFVCPSLYEGFGIPPLEAMAHNCPVVCSTAGSISEVVGNAGEFFDPTSEDELAAAVERVVSSPKRSGELKTLGKRRLADFSWQKCAQETHAVYSALL